MNSQLDLVVRLVAIAINLSLLLYLRLRARRSGLLRHFLAFLSVLLIWTAYPPLERSALSVLWPRLAGAFRRIYWLTVCFTGYIWLLFCLTYINRGLPLPRRRYLWLAVPPAVFYLAYLGDSSNRLFFLGHGVGVLYWLHTATIYAYVLAGNIMLLGYLRHQYRTARIRSALLAFATSVPLATSVYQHYAIFISPYVIRFVVDPMPAAFCLSASIFILVAYKYRFLDFLPAAFANIAALTKEALIVLDLQGLVAYANPAFAAAFGWYPREGDGLDDVLARLNELIPPGKRPDALRQAAAPDWEGEMELVVTGGSWYLLNVRRISDERGRPLGRVWSFTDITGYKRHAEELRAVNDRLAAANDGLARLAAVTGELAAAKEREHMAREIHDSLGHAFTVLIALLEADRAGLAPAGGEGSGRTGNMIAVARRGLSELRRVVSAQGTTPVGAHRDLANSLRSLAEAFQATGIRVDLAVDGSGANCGPDRAEAVYRICQEAMTNALRHGLAQNIAILLRFTGDAIALNIIDDGRGCQQVEPGFGLSGMEKRVEALGGSITYGALEPNGFGIRVNLPLEGSGAG